MASPTGNSKRSTTLCYDVVTCIPGALPYLPPHLVPQFSQLIHKEERALAEALAQEANLRRRVDEARTGGGSGDGLGSSAPVPFGGVFGGGKEDEAFLRQSLFDVIDGLGLLQLGRGDMEAFPAYQERGFAEVREHGTIWHWGGG